MKNQKKCVRCRENKDKSLFHKKSDSSDGLASWCKYCIKDYNRLNKEKRAEQTREYYLKNKKKINTYGYYYEKERKSKDSLYKFKKDIRKNIHNYIKRSGYKKSSKTFDILGLSAKDFKLYIESKFDVGMNWNNRGEWHIDHIIPVSSAENKEEAEILNHHLNLQPLWAKDNLSKSNLYTEKDKMEMIKIILKKKGAN
jgi:hypothetical protein